MKYEIPADFAESADKLPPVSPNRESRLVLMCSWLRDDRIVADWAIIGSD